MYMMEHIKSFIRHIFIPTGLSVAQLHRLGDHKYSAQDVSFLDELFMKRFWEWCVEQVPLWIAPNLITTIGLLCNILAVLILSFYCPDGVQEAPWWTYFLCGLCLFIYQTLDAIDGKQARRTGSASPLGELFDHGCDSLSQVFITLETLLCLGVGRHPEVFMFTVVCSLFIFYAAHWQTYVCGMLRFTRFDVTEAQFIVIILCAVTGVFGPGIWQIGLLGYPLSLWIMAGGSVGFMFQLYKYFLVIFTGGVGKNGSTVAGTSVLFPIIPISIPLLACSIIYFRSETPDFQAHMVLYSILFGLVASKITNGLVVAHMSRSEMATWDSILLGPSVLFFNQYWGTVCPEYSLLWVAAGLSLLNYVAYSYVVVKQLCTYLNIYCFSIRPKAAKTDNKK